MAGEEQPNQEAPAVALDTGNVTDKQNDQMEGGNDPRHPNQNTSSNTNANINASRKRKRPLGNTLTEAYSSVSFAPRKSTGMPDSPDFFFSASYNVGLSESTADEERKDVAYSGVNNGSVHIQQVVHHHVNGLCMVTAGDFSIPPSKALKSIRFIAKEAAPCSNAEKRKRQAKMLRGRGKVDPTGTVSPSTVIAELIVEDKKTDEISGTEDVKEIGKINTTIIPLRACVWGTILELNSGALTPQVLLDDPLLDGFIAIILPSGRFPPPANK
mmetsp:Transcript_5789/g.11315  ORF Transcript_5789/g.11315 Transcript_5789/m.11315 type:complete len:271 (-) Transcript_5789:1843-2655(-)